MVESSPPNVEADEEMSTLSIPNAPDLGKRSDSPPDKLHVLGDIHGWAPGLINYLIKHKLADISIDEKSLGNGGQINESNMEEFFGRTDDGLQIVGLRGLGIHEDATSLGGLGPIKARWIAESNISFIQIGDVFDRADYSDIAVEILRQLIIDAPDRVFVLVGNHEQFMLENSIDNWLLNEERNAIKDFEDLANGTVGKHTRFLPEGIYENYTEKATKVIFPCYRNSVFTLYLTQAAAQQKSGFIDRELPEDLVESLLSPGWEPYERVEKEYKKLMVKGEIIPGAMVAFVVGDNLFHHAEPGEHLFELTKSINWVKSYNIGWLDYIHGGGSIQGTEHSPLLWTRGASNGALSGSPKTSTALTSLTKEWPGLFRIIHGHTPTISDEEFRRQMNSINSTTCSYNAQNKNQVSSKGVASNIRVYNVDEAMSPVYYQSSNSNERDDVLRIPNGLRVATLDDIEKPVIIHEKDDLFLTIEEGRDVKEDTRKFWKWSEGNFRITSGSSESDSNYVGEVFEFANMHWIVKASEFGRFFILNRLNNIQDLILDIIDKSEIDFTDIINIKPKISPTLEYISHNGELPFLPQFKQRKPSLSAELLSLSIFGFRDDGNIITINATNDSLDYHYLGKKSKIITSKPNTISRRIINLSQPAIFSLDKIHAKSTLNYWLDKNTEELDENNPSISFWPIEKSKSLKIKTIIEEKLVLRDSPKKISGPPMQKPTVGESFQSLSETAMDLLASGAKSVFGASDRKVDDEPEHIVSVRSQVEKTNLRYSPKPEVSVRDQVENPNVRYSPKPKGGVRGQVETPQEHSDKSTKKIKVEWNADENKVSFEINNDAFNNIATILNRGKVQTKYPFKIQITREQRKSESGRHYYLKIIGTNPKQPNIRINIKSDLRGISTIIKALPHSKKSLGFEPKTLAYILGHGILDEHFERLKSWEEG